jgi:hypothetical protein
MTVMQSMKLGIDVNRHKVPYRHCSLQCCGSGSGDFLTPGSGIGKKSRSGSGMNIPDHISESLETIFWV